MADLDVQPKKNNSWWIWILLLLIALALLFFFLRGRDNKGVNQAGKADSVVAVTTATGGSQIDFNSPKEAYEEMTDTSISVRGNKDYTIYGLGEDILFDKDKNTLKSSAEIKLKQIVTSLNKRFKGADLSIYGHTDSTGTAAYNKELGGERAEAVRSWFIKNGIVADKIAVHSFGETNPVASNETAEGRQQNRSVAIVATATKK